MAYTPQAPGPQNPGKYPFTGSQYAAWGEQPGFIYDPYRDAYMPDKNAAQGYYQSQGLIPPPLPGGEVKVGPDGHTYQLTNGQWHDITPKKPGLLESVAPLGAAALAYEGGKQGASALFSGFGGGGGAGTQAANQGPGLFSNILGHGGSSQAATTANQAPGLLGSSGAGAAGGGSSAAGAGSFAGGADAAGSGAAQVFSGQGTMGGQGLFGTAGANPLLSSAGYAAGAYTGMKQGQGLLEAAKGDKMGWQEQAALALPTFGLSLLYNPARDYFGFGNKHHWKDEKNDLNDLAKKGVYVPENLIASMPNKAQGAHAGFRTDQGLAADYIGRDQQGNWVNNKFAQSRNVADLRPEDIVNFSTFAENDPDWFKKPLDQRLTIAQQALDAGAVREGHGQVKVDWNKFSPAAPPTAPNATAPGPMPKGPQGQGGPQILAPRDNLGSPGRRPKKK